MHYFSKILVLNLILIIGLVVSDSEKENYNSKVIIFFSIVFY